MTYPRWYLPADRYFDPDPAQRRITRELYESVADLPIVSPHGHREIFGPLFGPMTWCTC